MIFQTKKKLGLLKNKVIKIIGKEGSIKIGKICLIYTET
jgi:hypothetical protein